MMMHDDVRRIAPFQLSRSELQRSQDVPAAISGGRAARLVPCGAFTYSDARPPPVPELKARAIGLQRLTNLQVASSRCTTAGEVVTRLGAMQAQDYAGALWAIGLRLPGSTLPVIQQAIEDRSIVRTWPMRGTLHFVAAADVVWMLDLLGPRAIAGSAKRHRDLELDAATFRKVEKHVVRALEGGRQLTRDAIRVLLERAKISTDGQRLYHCLWQLAQRKVLCFGTHEGKQPRFTLLSEWVPNAKTRDRESSLHTLATRYLHSHGPATTQDLMRWAGVTQAEAKLGIAGIAETLTSEVSAGISYWMPRDRSEPSAAARGMFLLPGFDEYMLGYKDRSMILDRVHAGKIVPGNNGVFRPSIVHDARVIGTWKAVASKKAVRVEPSAFQALTPSRQRAIAQAAARYATFLELSTRLP